MKRRLFNLAAALSLLLCVATVGLWVRSYDRTYTVRLCRLGPTHNGFWAQHCDIVGTRGSLLILIYLEQTFTRWGDAEERFREAQRTWPRRAWLVSVPAKEWDPEVGRRVQPFGYWSHKGVSVGHHERYLCAGVPLWIPILILGISPTLALFRLRTRIRPGHCARCGYDLRATPERCPECGTVPAVK